MKRVKTLLWISLLIALSVGLALPIGIATAQSSENNARLKQALKQYPQADTNQDGVLTRAEARAFMKLNADTTEEAPKVQATSLDGEKHIYKKVGDLALPLYVYQPSTKKSQSPPPAIVFFHGGGWRSGSPTQFENHCKYFAERGMVAITVQYRLTTQDKVKVEDCIADAKSAMRWVRGHAAQLGIDANRIAAGGGSAGGHLAACTSLMKNINAETDDLDVSCQPDAMVLFNPFMGLTASDDRLNDESRTNGQSRTNGPPEKIFPLTYASQKQPPCIMFFGTADKLKTGADAFLKRSKDTGNDCRMVTYEGQGHGFFNHGKQGGKYYRLTVAEADKFLIELGWLKAKSS